MTDKREASYGAWESPIRANLLAKSGVTPDWLQVEGKDVYWVEMRPSEGGRYVIVRCGADGAIDDITPEGFNARTLVHEYGGGMYWVFGDTVYFTNFADQRLYKQVNGGTPEALSPEPSTPRGLRYADGCVSPDGTWIVCVRESHEGDGEAVNELVAIAADGSTPPHVIATGRDFYSTPRFSPDGTRLAWLCWDHPNMPWDGTELWVADFTGETQLDNKRLVAGGPKESIFQPAWSPDGRLYFISDRSNWWNLYRDAGPGTEAEHLSPMSVEFGQPQWVLGFSRYAFLPDGRIACIVTENGFDSLLLVDEKMAAAEPLPTEFTVMNYLHQIEGCLWLIGASPTTGLSPVRIDLDGTLQIIPRGPQLDIDPVYFAQPEAVSFPTEGGKTAHAFYYPPTNPDFVAPPTEQPPLLVISHGGPTSANKAQLSLSIQFWTSRGFGVVDVNYGGSTGYGREYRERLEGQWGVVDVEDCINAAKYLAKRGLADGQRVAVRGGSAGGYTTLMALTKYDYFAAGASYYGLSDLEIFVHDTHKFESRYLYSLIGPWPEAKDLYADRSPVTYADGISCPMILLQGDDDKVVPPSQAEIMVRVLEEKRLPYAYLLFAGEQHGFRQAQSIIRANEAELYFYGKVFGFDPADEIEPVDIHNLP